jgi:hypothetical protein
MAQLFGNITKDPTVAPQKMAKQLSISPLPSMMTTKTKKGKKASSSKE